MTRHFGFARHACAAYIPPWEGEGFVRKRGGLAEVMLHIAKWKIIVILALTFIGVAFAAPNLVSRPAAAELPDWLPHKQISLGLDLQGGSYLLYEVDTRSLIDDELNALEEAVRQTLFRERIFYTALGVAKNAVTFRLRDPGQLERVRGLIGEFTGAIGGNSGGLGGLVGNVGAGPPVTLQSGDNGEVRLQLSDQAIRDRESSAVQQSLEIIRRRIDATGVREPTIVRDGVDRILVELPGVSDPERMKTLIGKTAKMTFHMVDDNATPAQARAGKVPGASVLPLEDKTGGAPSEIVVFKRVEVDGARLEDAQATFQQGRPVVSFRFDGIGARRFGEVTRENVGHRLAIVLDGKVISAPVIKEPILGGSGVISGNFTAQSAQDLALLLRAGALPAPLNPIEERSVGPTLGSDSIHAGELASALGFALVVGYMVMTYGLFGLFASTALVINIVLIIGALSALQATLTLPGIAGIVLTMGMAVDANVLIYERLREEVRAGRSMINAIDAGFRRAMATIIDSNLTTLIAGVLLYIFGSGPVKGFAVTLSLGIITSIFSAVMLTRLMVIGWLRRWRPKTLPI
jgi:preprotein translocase subunit SecD